MSGVFEIVAYRPHPALPQIDYLCLNTTSLHETVESHMYLTAYATFLEESAPEQAGERR